MFLLRNNPSDTSGTHIWNWAATYMKDATPENKPSTDKTDKTDKTDTTNKTDTTKKDPVKTGDTTTFVAYIAMLVVAAFGIILTRRKRA